MEFLEEAKTMDQCTHEVRLQYWKNIISQCQARPEGQSAKQWLADNGICEHRSLKYYIYTLGTFGCKRIVHCISIE